MKTHVLDYYVYENMFYFCIENIMKTHVLDYYVYENMFYFCISTKKKGYE